MILWGFMNKDSLLARFLDWEKSHKVDTLNQWEQECSWEQLNLNERQVLARLFLLKAASAFAKEKEQALFTAQRLLSVDFSSSFSLAQQMLEKGVQNNDPFLISFAVCCLEPFEKTLSSDSDKAFLEVFSQAYYEHAKRTNSSKHLEAVIDYCRWLKKQEAKDPQALACLSKRQAESLFLLGEIQGEACDYFQALQAFVQAQAFYDDSWEFCSLQAICYERLFALLGKIEFLYQAKNCFEKALLVEDKDLDTNLKFLTMLVSLYLIDGDDSHLSRAQFLLYESLPKDLPAVRFQLSRLLFHSGRLQGDVDKMAQAKDLLESLLFPHELLTDVKDLLVEVYLALGQDEEDLTILKKAEAFFEDEWTLENDSGQGALARIKYLVALGEYFGEVHYFHEALGRLQEYHGNKTEHFYALFASTCYELFLLNKKHAFLEQSLEHIEKAIGMASYNPIYWGLKGSILSKKAEYNNEQDLCLVANQAFEKALEIRAKLVYADLVWLCDYAFNNFLIGEFTQEEEDLEKVVELFSLILSIDPSYLDARFYLAQALLGLGSMTSNLDSLNLAIDHYKALLKKDEEDDLVLCDMGECFVTLFLILKEQGDTELAQENLQLAEESLLKAAYLGNTDAYYNLACLYSLKGRFEETLFYLQRAFATDSLPPMEEIMEDDWLEDFRNSKLFKLFCTNLF